MTQRLRTLDLFSGIGGMAKGLEQYSEVVAYCEANLHAQAVLLTLIDKRAIDAAPIWDDVKTLNSRVLAKQGLVTKQKRIDLITAGWPCQDISVAGAGKGLKGERSGLFFQIIRLARELKPTFIFLENVPAIRTRGLDTVLLELSQAGYDCRYGFLSAFDMGAPHKRERWFLLAKRRERGARKTKKSDHETANGSSIRKRKSRAKPNFWSSEPNISRVATGIPLRAQRIERLGNGVVPQCVTEAFERLVGLKNGWMEGHLGDA